MKKEIKVFLIKCKVIFTVFDFLLSPITLFATIWVGVARKGVNIFGTDGMPASEKIFMTAGVLPILDHYYQPLINPKKYLKDNLKRNGKLTGVKFDNDEEQLLLLSKFQYNNELLSFPKTKTPKREYFYDAPSFGPGDAEYLYSIVRHFKPGKIIEIGCGSSSLMIRNAVKYNHEEDPNYKCAHICIEPYEQDWLEQLGIEVIRRKVEDIDLSVFAELGQNDIFFIDSSHMIRPQGDVLFEYLRILPILKPGVIIHIHDIFTPNDYPDEWLNMHILWNEQYLLEAFLCFNDQFKVIGALNYLFKNHTDDFLSKFPIANERRKSVNPASFWMMRK